MKTDKPWGYEILLEQNDKYVVKFIFMKKGEKCSLQYHEHKMETIYLLEGVMLCMGQTWISGRNFTIKPGVHHRMEAATDIEYLECSTPELDDVVRLSDDYGRV